MKDKETQNNIFDILDKMEFFQGQRAGRELWNDKPKEVQDKDIADFIKDINYIRSYLQDSVVLSREEYDSILTATETQIEELKNYIKELKKENFKLAVDNEALKEEQEQLESDVYNYEMNLQHITAELKQARKETAEKDFNTIVKALEERKGSVKAFYGVAESVGVDIAIRTVKELAKQFRVEIKG